jgi:D-serine deaminase-like pyridoxal phosphate-dependent protein
VDSSFAVDVISAAADAAGATAGLLVDLDVGFHRTGVQTSAEALDLARHIAKSRQVRLDGLFCFPGHLNMMPPAQQADSLALVSAMLRQTIELWRCDGHAAPIVSGGSTPTAAQAHHVPEWTEIRPGTYIYCDRNCVAVGSATMDDCAATVLSTVVSTAVPGKCIIDAGSKTLTTDRMANDPTNGGFGLVVEYPEAKIVRLFEEHGELDLSNCEKRPKPGERIHVVPNHVCPCVNLFDRFWLRHTDGRMENLPVDARGKLT